ncbi:MAG: PUA domain-containing protein [Candidatus Hadarchaeales archaeon]
MEIKRYHLRKDKIRELSQLVSATLPDIACRISKHDVEVWEFSKGKLIFSSGEPLLILIGNEFIPPLPIAENLIKARVVVDMGAVAPICRGADVMGKGVKSVTDFSPGDLVIVVEEKHQKALAVGKALVPSSEAVGRSGKIVENLHHVGDEFWETIKSYIH